MVENLSERHMKSALPQRMRERYAKRLLCDARWHAALWLLLPLLLHYTKIISMKCQNWSFQVIVHRVVNIIDKRNPMPRPGLEFDRGYEDQRCGGPRNYQSGRGYHSEDGYQPDDSQYYDENLNYGSYRRNSPPHRNVSQLKGHDCGRKGVL